MDLDNPDFAVMRTYDNGDDDGHKIVVVDTEKARYHRRPWLSLSRYGRRKFENLVVLSEPKNRIRVFYEVPNHGLEYDREAAANAYYYRFGY